MKINRWGITTTSLVVGLSVGGAVHAAPTFTGDVPTDFSDAATVILNDPGGIDVGVPVAFPVGTISGNDIEAIYLFLDQDTDRLYVGYDFYTIGMDVDGDGDPNASSTTLVGLGGVDEVDVGGTESITLILDIDEDGIPDVTAGISAATGALGYQVTSFTGTVFAPGFAYGAPLGAHGSVHNGAPTALSPDYEFMIENFSSLPTSSGSDASPGFGINAFSGSFSDAGIGEDFIPGVGEFTDVCFDQDMDGITACDGDCDDEDDSIFPGAVEICDGIDQNCDGDIDEGFDGNGNGIPDCFEPEICDGIDNDGDGSVDEGLPDVDGDGICNERDGETCDGVDNDGDTAVDEGLSDVDGDGLCDELDDEECDGVDNDGDGSVDEGMTDTDGDGLCDDLDDEDCDGLDNDGDGSIDEGMTDTDGDGLCDDLDDEDCDGVDNDGDGSVDEGLTDTDGDGLCDGLDDEDCDGVDNDGDGSVDEGLTDTDGDGICDDIDGEDCDGADNDGDGSVDEGLTDTDGDGVCDGIDSEECDGLDNDGDGSVDEGMTDTDGDGVCDDIDGEDCDGADNDGDGSVDEGLTDTDGDGVCDGIDSEDCDGVDNDGDGSVDEGLTDTDGDGLCDALDDEDCDGVDNDGDGSVDEGLTDTDGDGVCDEIDTEECDGADNDGDGNIDEGFDSDGDGIADCLTDEICDDNDNDGDGSVDEGFEIPADDRTPLVGVFKNTGELAVIDNENGGSNFFDAGGAVGDLDVAGVTTTAYRPADGKLYFVTGEGDDALYTLDPETGDVVRVAAVSRLASNIQGMDFATEASEAFGFENGNLYAISIDGFFGCRPNCLFEIDPTTANATPIASLAVGQVRAVSFNPVTGALWVYDAGTKRLSTVAADGTMTEQMIIPHSDQQNGTGVDTMFSLAHDCYGNLFGIDLAYGVLLNIDVDAGQSYWIGDYGSVSSSDGALEFGGLDAYIDGFGQCICLDYDWDAAPPEPEATPTPTEAPTPTPEEVPTPGSTPDSCTVDYVIVSDWPLSATERAFHASVTLTVDSPAISGWLLEWDFDGDEAITQLWQGFYAQDAQSVTVWNETYNGSIPAGGSVNFGFLGEYSDGDAIPDAFTLNGVLCD